MGTGRRVDCGLLLFCMAGFAEWYFLATAPSITAIVIAASVLALLFLGYCALAVCLPQPPPPQQIKIGSFVSLAPSQSHRSGAPSLLPR